MNVVEAIDKLLSIDDDELKKCTHDELLRIISEYKSILVLISEPQAEQVHEQRRLSSMNLISEKGVNITVKLPIDHTDDCQCDKCDISRFWTSRIASGTNQLQIKSGSPIDKLFIELTTELFYEQKAEARGINIKADDAQSRLYLYQIFNTENEQND